MKKLTTFQQLKSMYIIQILIILWCIKTFIKYISGFKLWFSIISLSIFSWTIIQLCCRLFEICKVKDLEKEE